MIDKKQAMMLNKYLLGAVMLIPGLLKLFVMGPDKIVGMLSGIYIFAWAPSLFAWVLILGEIAAGAAIFANWNTKYAYAVGAVILGVAGLTVHWADWPQTLTHLALASTFLVWHVSEHNK